MVEEPDEYGNLNYEDKGITFRTMPGDRNEQFRDYGCAHHVCDPEETIPIPCPYHGPGGLKEKWDSIGKDRHDAQKKAEKEAPAASIAAWKLEEEKAIAAVTVAENREKAEKGQKVVGGCSS